MAVKLNVAKSIEHLSELLLILVIAVLLVGCRSDSEPVFTSKPDFGRVGETNALPEKLATPTEMVYRIRVGDLLRFIPPEGPLYSTRVREDGTVEVPAVGKVVAAGKTPDEFYREIAAKDSRYTRRDVRVADCCLYYYVGGEVNAPGPKVFVKRTTVSEAIRDAGGWTSFARTNRVTLDRADGERERITLGEKGSDPQIYPGDSITVPRSGIF